MAKIFKSKVSAPYSPLSLQCILSDPNFKEKLVIQNTQRSIPWKVRVARDRAKAIVVELLTIKSKKTTKKAKNCVEGALTYADFLLMNVIERLN